MALFSFKKETKCYLTEENAQGTLTFIEFKPIDISFSQTFTEKSHPKKGILNSEYFEASVINKANPANFEVSLYFTKISNSDDAEWNIVNNLWTRATSPDPDTTKTLKTFDLFIVTEQDTFSLQDCVITNWVFGIERLQPLSIAISGEATKLERLGDSTYISSLGSSQYRGLNSGTIRSFDSPPNREFLVPNRVELTVGGVDTSSCLTSLSLELQNDIKWTPYTYLTGAMSASDASTSMYPQNFTYDKKILSGTIIRYLSDDNPDLQNWKNAKGTLTPLALKVFDDSSEANAVIDLALTSIAFTNRVASDQLFTESYDWRALKHDDLTSLTLDTVSAP